MFDLLKKLLFGEPKKPVEADGVATNVPVEALSRCFALLRVSKKQMSDRCLNDALSSTEKLMDILEREVFYSGDENRNRM